MEKIRKQPSGKYKARVRWFDSDGTRHSKSEQFETKALATQWALEMENRKHKNELSTNGDIPFAEYFWKWFETYKEDSVSDRTYRTYLTAYHALKNNMSPILASKMDRKAYRQFIVKYGSKHAKSTVSKFNALYHACVKDAIYDGDIKKDFVRATDLVYDKEKTRQIEYLNMDDMQKLSTYIIDHHYYTSRLMILTALLTGARLGEIQGLTWGDISFPFHTITIKRSWNESKREFKGTKNESSKRIIRVNNQLMYVLQQIKPENASSSDQVFVTDQGTVPTSAAVNKSLQRLLKHLKIQKDGFHFHSLRHTHVAFLLANHIDLYIISKRLGHADVTTTSKTYSYLIEEYRIKSDNKIESILDNINNPDAQNNKRESN